MLNLDYPHPGYVAAAAAGLLLLWTMRRQWGPRPFQVVALGVLGLVCAWSAEDLLYLAVYALGLATAFAEILGKFPDEPVKALATPHATGYLALNGLIAAGALYVLELTVPGAATAADAERLTLLVAAGFGSMMIMRSKLFNLKVGGEDVAFGPEQVILVYLRWMEAAIDRERARARIEFVHRVMRQVNFAGAHQYSLTMLYAAQAISAEERTEFASAVKELVDAELDNRQKAYRLGFLLMNRMGEEFVEEIFESAPPECLSEAPGKERSQGGLLERIPFAGIRQDLPYMAYATSMSLDDFQKRLGWTDVDAARLRAKLQPRRCTLKDHRLAFNAHSPQGPGLGWATVVPEAGSVVEGVLYRLPQESIEYLDTTEAGYRRQEVTVVADGKETRAHLYVAEATEDGFLPSADYLRVVIRGAEAHGLPPEYVDRVRAELAALEAVLSPG